MSLPTFFYNDCINKGERNNLCWQFTIPDLLSKDVVFIPTKINENQWQLLAFLPLARTVISINSLSYENTSVLDFALFFLKKTYTSVHKISFNEEHWRYYNHQGIQKQENQSDCGVLVLLNPFAIIHMTLNVRR